MVLDIRETLDAETNWSTKAQTAILEPEAHDFR